MFCKNGSASQHCISISDYAVQVLLFMKTSLHLITLKQ